MNKTIASTIALSTLAAAAGAATLVNGSFEDLDASYVDETGWDLMTGAVATGWSSFNSSDWGLGGLLLLRRRG